MKKFSVGRKVVNGFMRLFGYAPNENGFLAKDYVVPAVVNIIEPIFQMLFVDRHKISADSAKNLVGYIYGLGKAIAIYAELKDPEISFFAAWQAIEKLLPGRKDLLDILHACEWEDAEIKEGIELGFADAALFLSGSYPVSRLSEILIERHEDSVTNEVVIKSYYEKRKNGTWNPAEID